MNVTLAASYDGVVASPPGPLFFSADTGHQQLLMRFEPVFELHQSKESV